MNVWIIILIIFLSSGIVMCIISGIVFLLRRKKCKPNHYLNNNNCISCCNSESPCLNTQDSKCTECIKYLFTLKEGVCQVNTDQSNIKQWLQYCKSRIQDKKIPNILQKITNEFIVWVNTQCMQEMNSNIMKKIIKDWSDIVNDINIQHFNINKFGNDFWKIYMDILTCGND